jgi:hypothetical protein
MESVGTFGRSLVAVVTAIVVTVGLTLATDLVLHAAGFFPPLGQPVGSGPLAVAMAYRIVYGVAGSYVAARLAPNRPIWHAMIPGILGFVVSFVGAAATWNRGLGPHWYPVALIVVALPCSWLGGWMRERQLGG